VTLRLGIGAMMVALVVAAPRAQTPRKIDTSPTAVIASAGAYVVTYQKDMAFVLADEVAAQHVTQPVLDRTEDRRTRAEFFLTYLPNDGVWISVRDVREVDGVAVKEADDIRSLIQRAPLSRLGSVIAEKNSRFNIGNVRRTFNEPTFGLLVVNQFHQRRFKFDRVSVTGGPAPIVTLKFTEKDRPTLIVGTRGEPVFTHGELDVDAVTGRVQRTRIEMTMGTVKASIATAYAPDAKLDLWVPAVMSEHYEQTAGERRETISVDSEYSNYRRFDTSVIIK